MTPDNHYFLNDNVNKFTMVMALSQLEAMDKALPEGEPLYLVLKTPGGSVIAGMEFISAVKQLSRPVITVTIQSISMGFQIVQSLGKRLVIAHGIFMTHPIVGTCRGRPVRIESCLNGLIQLANSMDVIAADRMSLPLKIYQKRSSEEWWSIGPGAIEDRMADEITEIRCNKVMMDKGSCPN
ncbi:MAG TPA: ATP-dependent Clp protease proteolytic subunit [Yeosuana sp.]